MDVARPQGLGRPDPHKWPAGKAPGGQRAWKWACAYRDFCRWILSLAQVPLGSSLEAAGAPPGPTAQVVTSQRHVGQGGRFGRAPDPKLRGGLRAPPRHPFLLQVGNRPRQEVAEPHWKDLPGQLAEVCPLFTPGGGPHQLSQCCPVYLSEEPQECPTLTPRSCLRLAVTGWACRQGCPALGCLYPWTHHVP